MLAYCAQDGVEASTLKDVQGLSLSLDHETRFGRNVEPLEWFPDRATQPSAEV